MTGTARHKVIIIGAGFSGLAMAWYLKQAGIDDFIILEKAAGLGGTWRENTYPGAECDVPSALYSFSFEGKPDWDYVWSEQPQILEYLQHSAEKYGLQEHIRFEQCVASAHYQSEQCLWQLKLKSGELLQCQFLIPAVGQLHIPQYPEIPGRELFAGQQFHSARWPSTIDFSGKRVAVIGSAASAAQFIPEVAKTAEYLYVLQRSPNWIAEKRDKPRKHWQQRMLERIPLLLKLSRLKTFLRNEWMMYPALKGNRLLAKLVRWTCESYLHRVVKDPQMRVQLTPDYPVGAKRVLVVEGFYEALVRDNVRLVSEAIASISTSGLLLDGGEQLELDVLIYGTGFVTNPFLAELDVRGREGQSLADCWGDGAHAYLGMQVHGFPNLFLLYGPNTNLGHNSIVLMSEAQAKFIVQAIRTVDTRSVKSVEVREEVAAEFDREMQQRLSKMAWSKIENSWYKQGTRVTNNWPGSVPEYQRRCRKFNPAQQQWS